MNDETTDLMDFYAHPGVMTDPGEHVDLLAGLPTDINDLCQVVQGNLLHVFWAERYGVNLSDEEKGSVNLRPVSQKLRRLRARDGRPLTMPRPVEQRQAGNCRDFSTLLVALLRYQGVPARARCGFGAYFLPGHFEDHWVCEYWDPDQARWILVDAQLDELQREVLDIPFDPLDVPRDQFVVAGQGWQICRQGQADPGCFGIFDMHGWWFIWGNVLRDFLALNKVEILPWDWWESIHWSHQLDDPLPPDVELVSYDRLAALALAGDEAFTEVRAVYEADPGLHIPADWIQ